MSNVEKYGTARQATEDNTIRRMRFACWITEATNTHSEYVILVAFARQPWLRERSSMLRYSTLPVLCLLGCLCVSPEQFSHSWFCSSKTTYYLVLPRMLHSRLAWLQLTRWCAIYKYV
jgi:hypothetical protein